MTRAKSVLHTEFGERIDRPDFQHGQDTALNHARQNVEGVITARAAYIVSGFSVTSSGTNITIWKDRRSSTSTADDTTGTALLAHRGDQGVEHGHVLVDGPASRTIDLQFETGTGAQVLYISMSLREDRFRSRAFWNPNATTTPPGPIEFSRNIATRRAADWAFIILPAATDAGPEWTSIATFTFSGGVISALTDVRPFYFEGQANTSPAYGADADWGDSANDRSNDRAQFGLTNVRDFTRAVQRQLTDIIGPTTSGAWWEAVGTGLSGMLDLGGTRSMLSGATLNWADTTGQIGNLFRLAGITAYQFIGASDFDTDAGATTGLLTGAHGGPTTSGPLRQLQYEFTGRVSVGGATDGPRIRLYTGRTQATTGAIVSDYTVNAIWDSVNNQWARDDPTRDSTLLQLSTDPNGISPQFVIASHSRNGTATWTDDFSSNANWRVLIQAGNATKTITYGIGNISTFASTLTNISAQGGLVGATGTTTQTAFLVIGTSGADRNFLMPLNGLPNNALLIGGSLHFGTGTAGDNVVAAIIRQPASGTGGQQIISGATATTFAAGTTTGALPMDTSDDLRTVNISGQPYDYSLAVHIEAAMSGTFRSFELRYIEGGG